MKIKLAAIVLLLLSVVGGIWLFKYKNNKPAVMGVTKDKYTAFVDEVYDKIQTNYWEKISDEELSNLFLLAANKVVGKQLTLKSKDKTGVGNLVNEIITSTDKKTDVMANITDVVLANLKPFGRSRLYSQTDAQSLSNTVNNVSPGSNYFDTLGVGKSADDATIKKAFETKTKEATTAAKKAEIKQAFDVLKTQDARQVYQISGVDPKSAAKSVMRSLKRSPT